MICENLYGISERGQNKNNKNCMPTGKWIYHMEGHDKLINVEMK